MGIPLREHKHPALCKLHWLPVEYQIRRRVLVLTLKALSGLGLWGHLSSDTTRQALCSGDKNLLVVPSLREVQLPSTSLFLPWPRPRLGGTLCRKTSVPCKISFHTAGPASQRCPTRLLAEGSNSPIKAGTLPSSASSLLQLHQ